MRTIENKKLKSAVKVVLIDDEVEAREVLATLLGAHPEISIEAVAGNADEGLAQIVKHRPDIVFLDIQMPQRSGFDLVSDLRRLNLSPVVIFITAYDEYAIKAFKVSAFDYLLKPVDPEALAETMDRFHATRHATDFREKLDHLLQHMHHEDRIRVNTRSGFILLDPAEILYAMADGNYTLIHFSKTRTELITLNMGSFLELLPAGHFLRISRSAVINKSFLYRVDRKKRICELRKDGVAVQMEVNKEFTRGLE